ncbi:MAG: hypothetical protein RLZZ196_123 [Bacteroidota bacterium]|jgi:hypothetical protein
MNLAIFYTGDIRHNQHIAKTNHNFLITALKEVCEVKIYNFTKGDPERGLCPYDDGEPDNTYRRGQGGAIQVWDFCRGVDRTTEDIVLRLRTDVWFTKSSIKAVVEELKLMIAGESGIAYFGSDWVNQSAGIEYKRLPVHIDHDGVVQDFIIMAKRESVEKTATVIERLNEVIPNKRRSGNKAFRYIIPVELEPWHANSEILSAKGLRKQLTPVHRILCHMWLIRKDYDNYPSDSEVCKDYIQSYIVDGKNRLSKKNLVDPHPMQEGIDWWRSTHGWAPKKLEIGEWWAWQSE